QVIGDKVHLNTNVNSLKTTLDKGAIRPDEIRWSSLTKLDIIDKDNVKVGNAVDVDFDVSETCLVAGGGFIEESLESIGLKADVDILVPGSVITAVGDKIQLSVSKDELRLTMENALENPEVKRAWERPAHERAALRVRLF
ncbi:MAG: hypothetical protein ACFFCP_07140, partial [Promethearchaeota archaeon]